MPRPCRPERRRGAGRPALRPPPRPPVAAGPAAPAAETLLPRIAASSSPRDGALDPRTLFARAGQAVWLEIGFGGGEHLAAQAERHPEIGFIGCEVFENGIARLLGEIARRGLDNIRIFADDARPLLDCLPPASIGRVFILFPDPWPKQRHHKRRLVAPRDARPPRRRVMPTGAELRLATDDRRLSRMDAGARDRAPAISSGPRARARRLARAPRRLAGDAL